MRHALAEKAEALGVEIYPGFVASQVLYNDEGAVIGVATGDMGVERNGELGPKFTRGMELLGKYTLIGEGVRGSLADQIIAKFDLQKCLRKIHHKGLGHAGQRKRAQLCIPQLGDHKLRVRLVGRDGRRRYDRASKNRLVAACLEPGVSVSKLALEYGVNANLLRKWIKGNHSIGTALRIWASLGR